MPTTVGVRDGAADSDRELASMIRRDSSILLPSHPKLHHQAWLRFLFTEEHCLFRLLPHLVATSQEVAFDKTKGSLSGTTGFSKLPSESRAYGGFSSGGCESRNTSSPRLQEHIDGTLGPTIPSPWEAHSHEPSIRPHPTLTRRDHCWPLEAYPEMAEQAASYPSLEAVTRCHSRHSGYVSDMAEESYAAPNTFAARGRSSQQLRGTLEIADTEIHLKQCGLAALAVRWLSELRR